MWSGSCPAGVWRPALVRSPVGGGSGAGVAGQVQAQVGGRAQVAARGDDLDGQVGGFQQPSGMADKRVAALPVPGSVVRLFCLDGARRSLHD